MTQKKYYVVWEGRKMGVFDNWENCKKSILGFNGAKYKSFPSLQLAQKAFTKSYDDYKEKKIDSEKLIFKGNFILNSIAVDAACSGNPGRMEYRGVETRNKNIVFKQGPFEQSSNNIGEFLALVHALAHMKKTNDTRPIYSDSKIAIGWVKGKKAKTNVKESEKNKIVFDLLKRAENWLKNNSYKNEILKWETKIWGEIPADYGRK